MDDRPTFVVEPNGSHWAVRLSGEDPVQFEGGVHDAWEHATALAERCASARVLALNGRGQTVVEERHER